MFSLDVSVQTSGHAFRLLLAG